MVIFPPFLSKNKFVGRIPWIPISAKTQFSTAFHALHEMLPKTIYDATYGQILVAVFAHPELWQLLGQTTLDPWGKTISFVETNKYP